MCVSTLSQHTTQNAPQANILEIPFTLQVFKVCVKTMLHVLKILSFCFIVCFSSAITCALCYTLTLGFIFIFLQILTPSLRFKCDDTNLYNRTITLRQTIPLTCPGEDNCEIDLKVSIPEDVQGRCPKIGFQGQKCAVKLSSENAAGTNIEVLVTCPNVGQYMQHDGIYQVYLETTAASGIWADYSLDPINVSQQRSSVL